MENIVKILITGDFYGGFRLEELILKQKYELIFNEFLPIIQKADLAITNLESPLIDHGNPIIKTGPAIKAIPETIEALKFAGFNLLTLANNHIMDFGAAGLLNTLKLCSENNIDVVGAGMSYEEATRTFFKKIKSLNVAIINIAENEWSTTTDNNPGAHPLNPVANFYKIKEANQLADVVIVIIHGGHEMYNLPTKRMKETYRFFVDAGANAVIGHHTHCYSGYEIYREAPIFYSLGNFLFDSNTPKPGSWYTGYAVNLTFRQNKVLEYDLIPYQQSYPFVGINIVKDKELFKRQLMELNKIIQNYNQLSSAFHSFVKNKIAKQYEAYLEPFNLRPLSFLQKIGIFPSLISSKKRRLYLNLIRCESHRDVILKLLDNDSHS
jgi:poly-gamma-glutamate synthesis protein (capsule biosynthesis protein)